MGWSGLRSDLRSFLGVDNVLKHLSRKERTMATVAEALSRLAEQQQAASAAQLVSFQNLQTAVEKLRQSQDLSEEDQKAVDTLSAGFDTMIRDAQRADDGVEEPADVPPTEEQPPTEGETPVVEEPGTDTPPPAEGDSNTTR
jgi:hypothetical protein